MAFFGFRLDWIDVKFQRGKIPDDDLITFAVFVNQVLRGHATFLAGAMITGSSLRFAPDPRVPTEVPAMFVGPLDLAANDIVNVVYSAMNVSDNQGQLNKVAEDKLELKVLDFLVAAAVSAAEIGLIGAAITGALSVIGDPLAKFLGFSPDGPCNGLVFGESVVFSGSGLGTLPFPQPSVGAPVYQVFSFTRSYDDSASHNTDICGHIAQTDVHFSALKFNKLSLRAMTDLFFVRTRLENGVRQLGAAGQAVHVRGLFVR